MILLPAALAASFIGFALLALGQARPALRVAGGVPTPRRILAAACLALAAAGALVSEGWGFGLLLAAACDMIAACLVVATLTWRPAWLRPLAACARMGRSRDRL